MINRNMKLIRKNNEILEELIRIDAPYEEILKQSQKLDKYVVREMKKQVNDIKRNENCKKIKNFFCVNKTLK